MTPNAQTGFRAALISCASRQGKRLLLQGMNWESAVLSLDAQGQAVA
jgi:hypothetical protein